MYTVCVMQCAGRRSSWCVAKKCRQGRRQHSSPEPFWYCRCHGRWLWMPQTLYPVSPHWEICELTFMRKVRCHLLKWGRLEVWGKKDGLRIEGLRVVCEQVAMNQCTGSVAQICMLCATISSRLLPSKAYLHSAAGVYFTPCWLCYTEFVLWESSVADGFMLLVVKYPLVCKLCRRRICWWADCIVTTEEVVLLRHSWAVVTVSLWVTWEWSVCLVNKSLLKVWVH